MKEKRNLLSRITAFVLAVLLCITSINIGNVYKAEAAATFALKKGKNYLKKGTVLYLADGSSDKYGATYIYAKNGTTPVFCGDMGLGVGGNYSGTGESKFFKGYVSYVNDNKTSISSRLTQLCYWWNGIYKENNVNTKDPNSKHYLTSKQRGEEGSALTSTFYRSLCQALVWTIYDHELTSKKAIMYTINQFNFESGQGKYTDANDFYNSVFGNDEVTTGKITAYKGSGNTQYMLALSGNAENLYTGDATTASTNVSFRQYIKFRKTDEDGNPLANIVFAFRMPTDNNIEKIHIKQGILLNASGDNPANPEISHTFSKDVSTIDTNSQNTKEILFDSFKTESKYTWTKNGTDLHVFYVATNSDGYIELGFNGIITGKEYSYGLIEKSNGNFRTLEDTDSDEDKAKCKEIAQRKYPSATWKVTKTAAQSAAAEDVEQTASNLTTYIGLYEYGTSSYAFDYSTNKDTEYIKNSSVDNRFKWVKITKDATLMSTNETNSFKDVKNGNVSFDTFGSIDKTYKDNDGIIIHTGGTIYSNLSNPLKLGDGTTINSYDFSDHRAVSSFGFYNDGRLSAPIIVSGKLSEYKGIINSSGAKAKSGSVKDTITEKRTFNIHKDDTDGNPVKDATYTIKATLPNSLKGIDKIEVNGETVDFTVDGKEVHGKYKEENTNSSDDYTLEFEGTTDSNGDIAVNIYFNKTVSKTFVYGQTNYNRETYIDIETANDYNNLPKAYKAAVKKAVDNIKTTSNFVSNTYDYEAAREKAQNALETELTKLNDDINSSDLNFEITEIEAPDEYTVLNQGRLKITGDKYLVAISDDEGNLGDEEEVSDKTVRFTDSFKYYSIRVIKVDEDANKDKDYMNDSWVDDKSDHADDAQKVLKDDSVDMPLEGVKLSLWEDEELTIPALFYEQTKDENGKTKWIPSNVDEDGNTVEEVFVTDKDGSFVTGYLKADPNKHYFVKEVESIEGYLTIYTDYISTNDHIAIHESGHDIKDKNVKTKELIEVFVTNKKAPTVHTSLSDKQTKNDTSNPDGANEDGSITLIDTVYYENLRPNTEFTTFGTLMDKADITGQTTIKDINGNDVTGLTVFTTDETGTGQVDVEYTFFPTEDMAGKTAVAFEVVIDSSKIEDRDNIEIPDIVKHEDINDIEQTVFFPDIHTNAEDTDTENRDGQNVESIVKITDVVSYYNLIIGREYKATGYLVEQTSGKTLYFENGDKITSEAIFTAETIDGQIEIPFEFNIDGVFVKEDEKDENSKLVPFDFNNTSVVVFEDLYDLNGVLIKTHANINDEEQTIRYKEISTTATDTNTGTNEGLIGKTIKITDKVSFKNLIPGNTYTVKGRLMDKESGLEICDKDGNIITSESTFTPDASEGYINITFEFDNDLTVNKESYSLKGKDTVVFERLLSANGSVIAKHEDINDEGQTVHYNNIKTTAISGETGGKTGYTSDTITIIDTVMYENLIVGNSYTVSGKLMDKESGKVITDKNGNEITASTSFTAESENGSVDVTFTFNSTNLYVNEKAYSLLGKSVVVFERLYNTNGKLIGSHEDIEDKDQTVDYPLIGTVAKSNGRKNVLKSKELTITDEVNYTNLVPGREYKVTGTLMDPETGKAVLIDNKEVTGTTTFVPEEKDGTTYVDITFNAEKLKDGKYVLYEEAIDTKLNIKAAEHKDINSKEQTVTIGSSILRLIPKTGRPIVFGIILIVLGAILLGIYKLVEIKNKN